MKFYSYMLSVLMIALLPQGLRANSPSNPGILGIQESCESLKKVLAPGDLVFIQIDNIIYRKLVAEITSSWASHVGIAFKNSDGKWFVSESTTMRSRETDLCKYLSRTKGIRFEVRRWKQNLNPTQVASLLNSARQRMGIWYDTGFDYDEQGTTFCSKFVYDVYQEAMGLRVGKIETFAEIRDRKLKEDPDYDYSFIYLWFMRLRIPWERRTVTPESQRIDKNFRAIFESPSKA